jgi:L-ascorbate metabolism protein UlaG (beta-lactamase superfamily)
MKLRYLGHSAFQIVSSSGTEIVIDPFLDNNPLAPFKSHQVSADYIIITHAHGDHIGDALKIAETGKTTFVCVSELAGMLANQGHKTHAMQIGGAFTFSFGRLKLVPALHGSMTPDGRYAGLAAGVVLSIDGKCIYHCGDTGLFGDMRLIGEMFDVDYMLVPIGGNYTMDIGDAIYAVRMINPKIAIPMHYNTFDLIRADPESFAKQVKEHGYSTQVLSPGDWA